MVPGYVRRNPLSFALALGLAIGLSGAAPLASQTPAADPSERLRTVLPAEVAERVLARIAEARAQALPAQALEHRALELAAKGVPPADIETGIARHANRLGAARAALVRGGRTDPADEETEAAELVIRHGAGGAVSSLAQSTPSGESMAVPLFVLAGLMDRGLPSDQAIARVHAALAERSAARAQAPRLQRSDRGKPTTVPSNNGRRNRPQAPGQS
jgi:hypothetical protein